MKISEYVTKRFLKEVAVGFVIAFLSATLFSCSAGKQVTAAPSVGTITNAVDSSKWVFTVNQVQPLGGGTRIANGVYTLSYSANKIIVYLPYFGNAFSGADVLSGKNPLDFISENFTTNKEEVKEGEWRIIVEPKDNTEVRILNFTLYSNGNASLNVTMTNRTAISYTGNISAK
ncbi:MAG: DUF4251 domain-containing protein [Ferruginibacter sp.]